MIKELFTFAERIKYLRENVHMTQAALAKKLDITRAAVNSWEMGFSIPSTSYIVELAKIFDVSADYLLGLQKTATVSVEGLTDKQVAVLLQMIDCFKHPKR